MGKVYVQGYMFLCFFKMKNKKIKINIKKIKIEKKRKQLFDGYKDFFSLRVQGVWVGLFVYILNLVSELFIEYRIGFFLILLSCSGKVVVKVFYIMFELFDEVVGIMIREVQ